ncbi:MAG: hypothetical protein H0V46_03115 [Sphingomonas sp.]|nr:hypothetical protein [Sphingomonas sp.]
MSRPRNFYIKVEGLLTQRGRNMVKITEYEDTHYEYASELVGNFSGAMARMGTYILS